VSGQLHDADALFPGQEPSVPTGPHWRPACYSKEKKNLPLPRIESRFLGRPASKETEFYKGRAVAQAVSRWLPTAASVLCCVLFECVITL
jgi:hypothetical protein